jgi:hypothetical protein
MFLKTHFTNFINLDVSRVTGFPEFPNNVLADLKQPEVMASINKLDVTANGVRIAFPR